MEASLGTVTVHPSVLATVARLTALATPGVARMRGERRMGVGRAQSRPICGSGVGLSISDDTVTVDLYVVAEPETGLLGLGETLQREVGQAIEGMIGMKVLAVNVHIQDVDIPLPANV